MLLLIVVLSIVYGKIVKVILSFSMKNRNVINVFKVVLLIIG